MYVLLNTDHLPYRREYVGTYPSIDAAINAIPAEVVFWEHDAANDAADAFAANGSLYVVERAS
jgi:hypothetical protein